jgi:hypothetical protein
MPSMGVERDLGAVTNFGVERDLVVAGGGDISYIATTAL